MIQVRRPQARPRSRATGALVAIITAGLAAIVFGVGPVAAAPASNSQAVPVASNQIALGGFVLPVLFGALLDLTGVRSSAFMLMYGVVWVSLIWMYRTEVSTRDVVRGAPAPAS